MTDLLEPSEDVHECGGSGEAPDLWLPLSTRAAVRSEPDSADNTPTPGVATRPGSGNRRRPATPPGRAGFQAPSTNIRVVCRVRPMSDRETKAGTVKVVTASKERKEVAVVRMVGNGTRQVRTTFNFDDVLTSSCCQSDVFDSTLRPLVSQVLAGFETTAFAYGQTGTGKTYTMEGDLDCEEGRGLVPRTAKAIIDALQDESYSESSVTVSYLEIYNEELSDLLALPNNQQKLDIKDVGQGRGVCCMGLSEVPVTTMRDILELVRRAQVQRKVAETRTNARSSRSHSIFTMKVRCRKQVAVGELETFGTLHLVDLAGSECAKKGGPLTLEEAMAAARLAGSSHAGEEETRQPSPMVVKHADRERRNINQSLLTLGRVISALRDGSGRIPYRDSKLTRLLQSALGGHCRTVIIATISPALSVVDETISTLSYAEQASGIHNRPVASSLLRTTRLPTATTTAGTGELTGSSSGFGASEWAELEIKVAYLTQEVETAQAALANKFQEAQQNAARAEFAEGRTAALEEEVRQVKLLADEETFARTQFEDFALKRTEEAQELDDMLTASISEGQELADRLSQKASLLLQSRHQAAAICNNAEKSATSAREAVTLQSSHVKKALCELAESHQDVQQLTKKLQAEQGDVVEKLVQTIKSGQESSKTAVSSLAQEAKTSIELDISRAVEAIVAVEAAVASSSELVSRGCETAQVTAREHQLRFAEKAASLRQDLASRREALAAMTKRTNAALAAAAEAVADLSGFAEASVLSAEEALQNLEDLEVEAINNSIEEVSALAAYVHTVATDGTRSAAMAKDMAHEAAKKATAHWSNAELQALTAAAALEASLEEAASQFVVSQSNGDRSLVAMATRDAETAAAANVAHGALVATAVEALNQQFSTLKQHLSEAPLSAFEEDTLTSQLARLDVKRSPPSLAAPPSLSELLDAFHGKRPKENVGPENWNTNVQKLYKQGTPRLSTSGKLGVTVSSKGLSKDRNSICKGGALSERSTLKERNSLV